MSHFSASSFLLPSSGSSGFDFSISGLISEEVFDLPTSTSQIAIANSNADPGPLEVIRFSSFTTRSSLYWKLESLSSSCLTLGCDVRYL